MDEGAEDHVERDGGRGEATDRLDTVAVLEVGGTHVTAGVVERGSWRVVAGSLRRAALAGDATAPELTATLVRAADALEAPPGTDLAVALPGPFDYARGIGRYRGVAKFDALDGHDLRASLTSGLANPPGRLTFVNDAEAYALGEWLAGAARGARRCVGITIGTGIGSAFLDGGRVVDTGSTVPPGGSLHRTRIGGLPLEDVVSRRAILSRFADAGGDPSWDVREIAAAARAGDDRAGAVLGGAMRALGEAAGPWLRSFRADVMVVGGSMAGSWDLIGAPLREGLAAVGTGLAAGGDVACDRVEVRVAAHPETSPLVGAAWAATPETPTR